MFATTTTLLIKQLFLKIFSVCIQNKTVGKIWACFSQYANQFTQNIFCRNFLGRADFRESLRCKSCTIFSEDCLVLLIPCLSWKILPRFACHSQKYARFWFSFKNFYLFAGSARKIMQRVRDYVSYQNLVSRVLNEKKNL